MKALQTPTGGARTAALAHSPARAALRLLPIAAALVAVSGCSLTRARPDPTRFYVLAAAAATPAPAVPRAAAVTIGLAPVGIPAYLKTNAIVVLDGSELRGVGDARWAEPLPDGVLRLLAGALRGQPAVRGVLAYPAPHDEVPDVELFVRVEACEGVVAEEGTASARFAATWSVRSTRACGRVVTSGRYAPQPGAWDGRDAGALARVLGESVSGLAAEIAAGLKAAADPAPGG